MPKDNAQDISQDIKLEENNSNDIDSILDKHLEENISNEKANETTEDKTKSAESATITTTENKQVIENQSTEKQTSTPNNNKITDTPAARIPGALYDGDTLIARPGAERRYYTELVEERKTKEKLTKELEAYKHNEEKLKQFGFSSSEMLQAGQFLAKYKENPVQFVHTLLEQLQANGYNVNGQASNPLHAVGQLIDKKLEPLLKYREEEQNKLIAEQADIESANEIINRFYNTYEDAQIHENVINSLVIKDPNLSLERAYYELKLYAQTNQLDWSKPLAEQLQAKRAAAVTNTPVTGSTPQGSNTPMHFQNSAITTPNNSVIKNARADDSWDDIVKQAMAEVGFR